MKLQQGLKAESSYPSLTIKQRALLQVVELETVRPINSDHYGLKLSLSLTAMAATNSLSKPDYLWKQM